MGIIGLPGKGKGELIGPFGLAVDAEGSLYVVETSNHRVQKFNSEGKTLLLWGEYGKEEGQFNSPESIAIWSDTIYVTDTGNHRIQKFTSNGTFLAQWRGFGTQDLFSMLPFEWASSLSLSPPLLTRRVASHGIGEREFQDCIGLAANAQGEVYVVDAGQHRLLKFDKEGRFLTQWGRYGSGPGQFWTPLGVEVDREGAVYVADSGNHRIQKFTPDGTFITEFGNYGSDPGEFHFPMDLAVSSDGKVYVVDTFNNRTQIFTKIHDMGKF